MKTFKTVRAVCCFLIASAERVFCDTSTSPLSNQNASYLGLSFWHLNCTDPHFIDYVSGTYVFDWLDYVTSMNQSRI